MTKQEIKFKINKIENKGGKVCIVTVLYKSEKHIDNFLYGLENNLDYIGKIVVVDNNSKDKSTNIIKSWCNKNKIEIICIVNEENTGYTAAANVGIKIAEKEFAYILLTNNDLLLKKGALKTLLSDSISSDSDLMGIPGKSDDGEIFFGFNYKESYLKLIRFMQIRKSYADFLLNKEINYFPCDFPSGLILLFNKSFFQKIGYFDEELFFSGDETDFAIRINKNKLVKVFVSLNSYALVDHVSFGTSGNSMIKNKNYIRGYVYILLKHTDKILSLRYWIRITYYVLSIIYARPHYALHLIYFTFFYTFKFRELKNK